jgi:hypothetical protein
VKILKSSISLLLVLGGGIGLTSYLTSCSCSNSISPHGSIPFTNEYFTWTTSSNELTITGLKDNPDLKKYNTLSIPATCIDNDIEYRVTAIGD